MACHGALQHSAQSGSRSWRWERWPGGKARSPGRSEKFFSSFLGSLSTTAQRLEWHFVDIVCAGRWNLSCCSCHSLLWWCLNPHNAGSQVHEVVGRVQRGHQLPREILGSWQSRVTWQPAAVQEMHPGHKPGRFAEVGPESGPWGLSCCGTLVVKNRWPPRATPWGWYQLRFEGMEFDGLRWKMQSTGDVHGVDDGIMCYALMIEPSVSTVDALQTAFVYHQWGPGTWKKQRLREMWQMSWVVVRVFGTDPTLVYGFSMFQHDLPFGGNGMQSFALPDSTIWLEKDCSPKVQLPIDTAGGDPSQSSQSQARSPKGHRFLSITNTWNKRKSSKISIHTLPEHKIQILFARPHQEDSIFQEHDFGFEIGMFWGAKLKNILSASSLPYRLIPPKKARCVVQDTVRLW